MMLRTITAFGFATLLSLAPAQAAIVFNDVSRGSYIETGIFGTGLAGQPDGNYLTGLHGGDEFRSFFVFDLTGFDVRPIGGSIGGATLHLSLGGGGNIAAHWGGQPTATLGIFDYTSSVSDLRSGGAGLGGYSDLGSGAEFGNAVISTSDVDPASVDIVFDQAGVDAISNAQGGMIAFGGSITDAPDLEHFLFSDSIVAPAAQLQLMVAIPEPVPEPATQALFAAALLGLWRRKPKAPRPSVLDGIAKGKAV